MVAIGTIPERRTRAIRAATAFVYLTAVDGVTGVRSELPTGIAQAVTELRAAGDAPVVVGFGISRPGHVAALTGVADGVVVGSAIVDLIGGESDPLRRREAVRRLVAALRRSTVK